MESNSDWEKANRILEKKYPYTQKITLENTYGMHHYSKIFFEKVQTYFFVVDDSSSIEVYFKAAGDVVFALHLLLLSPTEESNSEEQYGDLLSVGKAVVQIDKPTVVIRDYNTVAWSKTTRLFRKTSQLIDGRKGIGVLSTFHAKYWFFRVPLDLLFHSYQIFIDELKTLEVFGSDHFSVYCKFYINYYDHKQKDDVETTNTEEKEEVEKQIKEGIQEQSNNR